MSQTSCLRLEKNVQQMDKATNPLETLPIWSLIRKYAIPSIISLLISAIYNITDQIFIGKIVGMYGNAATSVTFPLVTLVTAFSVLFGFGGAANFNLSLGSKKEKDAAKFVGNSISLSVFVGIVIMILTLASLEPLMKLFGATENTLALSVQYTGVTTIGIPFLVFGTVCSSLIRSDGSPMYSMISSLVGVIINIILNALFMLVFKWGILGSASATVIGQIISALFSLYYFKKFKTITMSKDIFNIEFKYVKQIVSIGNAYFFYQFVMMLSQIVMNNTLNHYGAISSYGSDVPFAVVAVVSKVSIFISAFLGGIGQSAQPLFGYNYGAKKYDRVKEVYIKALIACTIISVIAFIILQIFPRQIISIFGNGSEEYFKFAEKYMRVFMLMIFISGIQPLSTQLFTSIGNAKKGIILSLSRQGYFLIPLLLLLPLVFGIDGVLYAGPTSDILAAILSLAFAIPELKKISYINK